MFCAYQLGNMTYFKMVSNVTGFDINSSLSGWTIYVGSNLEANGEWSSLNASTFDKYFTEMIILLKNLVMLYNN